MFVHSLAKMPPLAPRRNDSTSLLPPPSSAGPSSSRQNPPSKAVPGCAVRIRSSSTPTPHGQAVCGLPVTHFGSPNGMRKFLVHQWREGSARRSTFEFPVQHAVAVLRRNRPIDDPKIVRNSDVVWRRSGQRLPSTSHRPPSPTEVGVLPAGGGELRTGLNRRQIRRFSRQVRLWSAEGLGPCRPAVQWHSDRLALVKLPFVDRS